MSDTREPIQRVWSAEEFNVFLNEDPLPARGEDTCVLDLCPGEPWRPASDDEMAAWLEKHIRRQAAEG